jgi:hypothetical protein
MIYALSFKHNLPDNAIVFNVTSRATVWTKGFSPFNLGPISLYDDYWAYNLENAYQFSGCYAEYMDYDGNPNNSYYDWAKKGWLTNKAIKYPLGVWSKPIYYWWNHKKLSRFEAQNQIFLPLYKKAIEKTSIYKRLKEIYENSKQDIILLDFEGYDHRFLDLNWDQVMNNPDVPIGQGFVLAMMLEGII